MVENKISTIGGTEMLVSEVFTLYLEEPECLWNQKCVHHGWNLGKTEQLL